MFIITFLDVKATVDAVRANEVNLVETQTVYFAWLYNIQNRPRLLVLANCITCTPPSNIKRHCLYPIDPKALANMVYWNSTSLPSEQEDIDQIPPGLKTRVFQKLVHLC